MYVKYLKQLNRNSIVNIPIYEALDHENIDHYGQLIKFFNYKFPQILFILGIVANSMQLVTYIYKTNKSLNKVYFVTISVTQLIALFCTLANYTFIDEFKSLAAYSHITCKLFNYIYRSMTNLTAWTAPLLILTTYFSIITKNILNTHKSKTNAILLAFVVILGAGVLDLIYIENIPIISTEINQNQTNFRIFYLCAMRNNQMMLLRDLIDFVFYFLLPFNFLFFAFYLILNEIRKYKLDGKIVLRRSKNYKLMLKRFKAIPLYFLIFNFPIWLVTFLNYYFNLMSNSDENDDINHSLRFEFYFTIILLMNQSHYFLITIINLFYDKFIMDRFKRIFYLHGYHRGSLLTN
ncbi:unnamed protein product [Brachionus calyciflorus]|uniref:G-protein coupled receptors family 1 profile domain-containing protein n=1 Tax=Brachionus calyciflorus TaxID=104777 RepID=A0A813TEJ1_9BILA|nr:unnamed protein product [Brachionus calyciflorus]